MGMPQRITMLILILIAMISQSRQTEALTLDGMALLDLKSGLIDSLGSLADWEESPGISTPCNWTGVDCNDFGDVISVNISGKSLNGSISGAIGSLKYLTALSLNSNGFGGPLPHELSLLTHLRLLNITNNHFTELPLGLSNLTELEVFDCYNNMMSGKLPLDIVLLRNLRHVHLGGNNFFGSIPSQYGNFSSSLEYLALSGNSLTGVIPPELGNLVGLKYLYLGWWNSFSDGIPPQLGMLSNLVLLDLVSCALTGNIPPQLANLTKLESLFLYNNELSGLLPPELGSLSSLLSFDISANDLSGMVPDSFGNLTNVKLMSFFNNSFVGEMPESLGDLPSLIEFQMWNNNFTGEIPQRLGSNKLISRFDVSGNNLTGGLPPDLCLGSQLTALIVMDNRLSGPIPHGISGCPSLAHVRLNNNLFNGSLAPGFFSLPNLSMLLVFNNQFTGQFPPVFQAPLLDNLDVSFNQLGGVIPESIGDLVSLMTFNAQGNQLTGTIPSRICDIPYLYLLDVSTNSLFGEIAPSLGNCSKLIKLDLSGNHLTGEIPSSLGNIPDLTMLNLSRNHLDGRIPAHLGSMQSLTQVDFSYNNLSGPVPFEGEAEFYNETVYVGNPLLCGGLLQPCPASNRTSRSSSSLKRDPTLLLVGAIFAASFLLLLAGLCCFFRRYRYYIIHILRKKGAVRPWKFTPFQRLDFTANDIVQCLCEENIIGKGGAGTVYKGQMPNGEMVAVKKLACGKGTTSHDHGFSAEIRTLGKIRHRYIVRLLGFCTNNEMNLLVYEYMPNGSLGELLHGIKSGLLDWTSRYNIAVQAANGLCYLHHDCSPLIVHRDVKSNNILLDSELGARVADFGLAKLFQDTGSSESMSSIAGSYGYIAPEYAYTLKVNEKSDIYSFGVVLMELLTGKRPIEPDFGDGVDIVQWVRTKIQTKEGVLDILDPRIGTSALSVPLQEVMLVLRVALLCSGDHPAERPTMRDVVQMLSDVRPGLRTSAGGSMDSRELQIKPTQVLLTDDLLTF